MPERHRGANPQDSKNFTADQLNKLKIAVDELSWLLSHNYAMSVSCCLVGDHYQLTSRQRMAITHVACANKQTARLQAKQLTVSALKNQIVIIDGFNLLITIETALGGGIILNCSDGCYRDLSAVYGSYKIVAETRPAIEQIGKTLEQVFPERVIWLFDRPVSNSGRLAGVVREVAEENNWPFTAELTDSTDSLLAKSTYPIVTCDSAILERTGRWCNLARAIITQQIPDAWVIDLTTQ